MGYCKPISVETTSVDDDLFDIADKSQVHSAVSDRASGFHILFLSRMEKDKGIYEAIEAYRILKDRHAEVSMAVAGSGPEHAYAMSYVFSRSIQDIEFCGYIEGTEKQKQYQKADVYILPTYGEGMPISVLEAMSYGLPVITRPVGGLRDFFEEGRMGFYTESVEPAVFSELLDRLYLDPELRSRIKAFNREYAKQRFAASRVAGRLEQIYREVLAA
jgi:glycosyltransferase involved in cell wall biosynthesis